MVLWILGAVVYLALLIVILSCVRASGAAERHAERVFLERRESQSVLEKQEKDNVL